MDRPDFYFEDLYPAPVAGVDEAGRGPWAGPVVAAAVILNRDAVPDGLNDSKKLSAKKRSALFDVITQSARFGVGIGSIDEIDRLNIARANDLAMIRAVEALGVQPAFVLIDGRSVPQQMGYPARAIIKGDGKSLSIAAASIVAKVTRDRIMAELDEKHPGYGWARNAGYGTAEHRAALDRLGVTPHHRSSFRPIHNILYEEN
ncbi:MAG: ribonuclease HII [Pseudomonadota bacterium]